MIALKRIATFGLSMLLMLVLIPVQAFAAGRIDLQQDTALTIDYHDGETPLSGAKFSLYFVATVEETGELTVDKAFSQFNVDIRGKNDAAWNTLASTLEGYVLRDGLVPALSGKTSAEGKLTFSGIKQGLYLVLGQRHTQNGYVYETVPFMVMLPALVQQTNTWDYALTVAPKKERTNVPAEGETTARKVLKIWVDDGWESLRPKQIEVQLLRDGKVVETVILNEKNNWRYTWTALNSNHHWTVVEKETPGYTVQVERAGNTFVVTNTYAGSAPSTEPKTPASSLPQTGQLWWPVPVLTALGLLLVALGLFCRRSAGGEW